MKFLLITFIFIYCNTTAQSIHNFNTCLLAKNIYKNAAKLKSSELHKYLEISDDSCNMILIDTLVDNFNRTAGYNCYSVLRNLGRYSDGDLTDYLVEALEKIFYHKFDKFFDYLYGDHKNGRNNQLESLIIECWSSVSSLSSDPDKEAKKIKAFANRTVRKSFPNDKMRLDYLQSLLNRINPKYLD